MASVTSVNLYIGGLETDDEQALDPAEPWRLLIPQGTTVFESPSTVAIMAWLPS